MDGAAANAFAKARLENAHDTHAHIKKKPTENKNKQRRKSMIRYQLRLNSCMFFI